MSEPKVLLVWNGFEEGIKYYLFTPGSVLAQAAEAAHDQYVGLVGNHDKAIDLSNLLDSNAPEDERRVAAPQPVEMPLYGCNIVAVFEAGWIP